MTPEQARELLAEWERIAERRPQVRDAAARVVAEWDRWLASQTPPNASAAFADAMGKLRQALA